MTTSLPLRTPPRFPQELFDLFVDAIADLPQGVSRRAALFSCSLVSRSFCYRARRHIFRQIQVHDDQEDDILQCLSSLHALMTWSPSTNQRYGVGGIAHYVKEFSFHASVLDVDERMTKYDEDGNLAAVLRILHGPSHGINKFILFLHWQSVEWTNLSESLQRALSDLIRSPNLRYLRICNVNRLPPTFLLDTHIKHLHLYECMPDDIVQLPPMTTFVYPQLESLDTDHELPLAYFEEDPDLHSDPRSSSLTHLRTLSSAVLISTDFAHVLEVLSRIRETLEHLDLRYYVIETPLAPSGSFDLTRHPNLRHLCLYHSGGLTISTGPGLALDDFNLFLEAVKPPSSLKTVELVILMDGGHETPQQFIDSFLADQEYRWATLDAFLAGSRFSSVRELILTFHFEEATQPTAPLGVSGTSFGDRARTLLRKALPALSASKKLNLTINVAFSSQVESWTPRTIGDAGGAGEG